MILNKRFYSIILRSIGRQPKRWLTISFSIILSTMLFSTIAFFFDSLEYSMIMQAKDESGCYHFKINKITEEKVKVLQDNTPDDNLSNICVFGGCAINDTSKQYELASIEQDNANIIPIKILKGAKPLDGQEIMISRVIALENNLEIGSEINVKKYYGKKSEEAIMTVSGVYTPLENSGITDTAFIMKDAADIQDKLYSVYIKFKKEKSMSPKIKQLLSILGIKEVRGVDYLSEYTNRSLLYAMGEVDGYNLYRAYLLVFIIVIISAAINVHNAVIISTQEQRKFYGTIKAIGGTAKQISKIIILEIIGLSLISIPIGILLSMIPGYILVKMVASFGTYIFIVKPATIIIIVVCFILASLISATYLPAVKAGSKSPSEAMKKVQSQEIYANYKYRKWYLKLSEKLNIYILIPLSYLYRNRINKYIILASNIICLITIIISCYYQSVQLDVANKHKKQYSYRLSGFYLKAGENLQDRILNLQGVKDIKMDFSMNAYIIFEKDYAPDYFSYQTKYSNGNISDNMRELVDKEWSGINPDAVLLPAKCVSMNESQMKSYLKYVVDGSISNVLKDELCILIIDNYWTKNNAKYRAGDSLNLRVARQDKSSNFIKNDFYRVKIGAIAKGINIDDRLQAEIYMVQDTFNLIEKRPNQVQMNAEDGYDELHIARELEKIAKEEGMTFTYVDIAKEDRINNAEKALVTWLVLYFGGILFVVFMLMVINNIRHMINANRRYHLPCDMSGGEQQRAAVARAMANKPAIIFADEPTGNLDKSTGQKLINLLLSSVEKLGQTLVIVTHNPEIADLCNRRYIIEDGVLREKQ